MSSGHLWKCFERLLEHAPDPRQHWVSANEPYGVPVPHDYAWARISHQTSVRVTRTKTRTVSQPP